MLVLLHFFGWATRSSRLPSCSCCIVPVLVAQLWRAALQRSGGEPALNQTLARLASVSLPPLPLTLMLLVGLHSEQSRAGVVGKLPV